jgi:hypothetical protein
MAKGGPDIDLEQQGKDKKKSDLISKMDILVPEEELVSRLKESELISSLERTIRREGTAV